MAWTRLRRVASDPSSSGLIAGVEIGRTAASSGSVTALEASAGGANSGWRSWASKLSADWSWPRPRPWELLAQVDQQPSPSIQQPVTGELPIGPDRPDDLLVDLPLDREPGQRPNLVTLAAVPPDPLAGQDQLGTMADRPGGSHRLLVAALQEHLAAGQGRRDGQGGGPVGPLGRLLEVLGHRHHH
jgi:hypothetical protein